MPPGHSEKGRIPRLNSGCTQWADGMKFEQVLNDQICRVQLFLEIAGPWYRFDVITWKCLLFTMVGTSEIKLLRTSSCVVKEHPTASAETRFLIGSVWYSVHLFHPPGTPFDLHANMQLAHPAFLGKLVQCHSLTVRFIPARLLAHSQHLGRYLFRDPSPHHLNSGFPKLFLFGQ